MSIGSESFVVKVKGWTIEGANWGTVYVTGPDRGGGWRDRVEFSIGDDDVDIEADRSCSYPCGHYIPIDVMVIAIEMWRSVTKRSQESDFPAKVD